MAVKTFDEVVLFARTGLNPRTNFKLGNGENKYITIKNIHNNELVIDENTDVVDDDAIELIHKTTKPKIKKGDILFCSIGRMGDMYIIPEEPVGWDINESVFAFTVNTDIVRQKYFYYIFKNQGTIKYLSKNSSGSTFKSIKMNQLKKMVFDLPSLSKQDKIVEVLDRLSLIIKKRGEELCKLDELIKARFVEMFGDPVINPYGLPMMTLGELSELITKGASPSWQGFSYTDDNSQTLFVTSENVREGYLDLSSPKYIEDGFNEKQKRSMIHKGDFLINIVGASIGRAAQFNLDCKANMNQAAALVRVNDDRIRDKYLLIYLNSEKAQHMYNSMKSDTGRANLSLQDINDLSIMIPPVDKQIEYELFVEQVDKSKVAVQKALDEAQLLFDSLMQEYFG